jgi:phosphatidate cytidylyltransferase
MLFGLLWNRWSFLILFSVIHFGCWWEYLKLVERICVTQIDKAIKYFLCFAGYLIFLAIGFKDYSFGFNVTAFNTTVSVKWATIAFMIIALIIFFFQNKAISSKGKYFLAMGFLYISLSCGLMIDLYMAGISIWCGNGGGVTGAISVSGHFIFPYVIVPFTIMTSLWINDTMAYIAGSLFGKTPLTKISPKKTWEGTVTGIILSIATTGLIFSNLNPEIVINNFKYDYGNYVWYIIAGISAIAGTFGDLFESKLKRMANVKDSGALMPGHGGFLDRFDSMLFAIPAVWLYIRFILQ